MPRVRLTGLFLFITAIFIALAAAATQTTHIRFKRPDRVVAMEQDNNAAAANDPLPGDDTNAAGIQFRSVPIVYPLLVVGFLGLLLWFAPAAELPTAGKSRNKRKRTRRKTRR